MALFWLSLTAQPITVGTVRQWDVNSWSPCCGYRQEAQRDGCWCSASFLGGSLSWSSVVVVFGLVVQQFLEKHVPGVGFESHSLIWIVVFVLCFVFEDISSQLPVLAVMAHIMMGPYLAGTISENKLIHKLFLVISNRKLTNTGAIADSWLFN